MPIHKLHVDIARTQQRMRSPRSAHRALIAAVAVFSVACGNASKASNAEDAGVADAARDGGGQSGPGLPYEWQPLTAVSDDVNQYLEAFCRYTIACLSGSDLLRSCREHMAGQHCNSMFETLELPGLAECVKALETTPCDGATWSRPDNPLPACHAVQAVLSSGAGAVNAGESCGRLTNCAADAWCDADYVDTCGTCQPQLTEGSACQRLGVPCNMGLHCSDAGTCEKARPAGATCEGGATQCASGICLKGRCGTAESLQGSPCQDSFDCGLALRCDEGKCTPALPLGAACEEHWDCQVRLCEEGKCAGFAECGLGGEGERCLYDGHCAAPRVCGSNSRCRRPLKDGEACERSADCERTSACPASPRSPRSPRKCEKKRATGAPCDRPRNYDDVCASSFCTKDGTCGDEAAGSCQ